MVNFLTLSVLTFVLKIMKKTNYSTFVNLHPKPKKKIFYMKILLKCSQFKKFFMFSKINFTRKAINCFLHEIKFCLKILFIVLYIHKPTFNLKTFLKLKFK